MAIKTFIVSDGVDRHVSHNALQLMRSLHRIVHRWCGQREEKDPVVLYCSDIPLFSFITLVFNLLDLLSDSDQSCHGWLKIHVVLVKYYYNFCCM